MQARKVILEHEWWFEDDHRRKQNKFNVILTTYEMVNVTPSPHEPSLGSLHWRCLVVDEAHRLKNAESKLMTALASFSYDHLLLLTG